MIRNDAVVLGLLCAILAFVFRTASSRHPFWQRFYAWVPSLLLCYFLPSLLATLGIIDGEQSRLYFVASRYLLPTSLVLLTLGIDLPAVRRLGPKAIVMFLAGTVGVVIGGPLALLLVGHVAPAAIGGGEDAIWRGLTTIAGSWIGGGANQAAMKEVFSVPDDLFASLVAVDVIVASLWMACLLFAAGRATAIDRWSGADTTAIEALRDRIAAYQASIARVPSFSDTMTVLAVGFGVTAVAHLVADWLAPALAGLDPALERLSLTSRFFWVVVVATTGGLVLSGSRRLRALEGVGASRLGSVMLYVLVASIGMRMDLGAVVERGGLLLVGVVWILVHVVVLLTVARLIRAPVFFVAVGSQANIGGAASAPIVAAAFHPALAPVGVLLAVPGYALGTYAAWLCGQLMRVAGQ
ncbi:MAG: DUF819 family protein [Candidatus Eiseniibacteriota bacterium]|jgi:uncharacterized membrane protein